MVSPDAAWSSGASGIACDEDIAARLRQTANMDATSIFTGIYLSSQICRDAAVSNSRKTMELGANGSHHQNGGSSGGGASPSAVVPVMPAPVAATPVPMTAMHRQ